MAEDFIYQLTRIGPPSTCPKVPDVMKLDLGVIKIGRGQHNDYYLDSAVLKNFISRSHVEIEGRKNENGEVEFVLTDKGLNGTFINDIRTHRTCTMEVGDKVTFGHTNGYKIQPGSYAEQPLSEFQFEFHRIPKPSKTSEMYLEGTSSSNQAFEDSDSVNDLKKDSVSSERLFLTDIKPNTQASSKSKQNSAHKDKSRSRKDSSSQSSQSEGEMSPPPRSSSSSRRGKRGSGVADDDRRSTSSGRRTGSAPFSETLPAEESDDDDNDDEEEDENREEEKMEEEEEEEEEVDEVVEPRKKHPRRGKQASSSKKEKKTTPTSKRKAKQSDSDDSFEEDDEYSKPEADQRPKTQISSGKSANTAKQGKKKKIGNDAPAVGSRKKRRSKGPGSAPVSSGVMNPPSAAAGAPKKGPKGADLEPGVEWYEDDTCDAADCKRPKKKRTPWVQCDDCDGWYHTVCVGANYKKLKDSDEHFNCGCE